MKEKLTYQFYKQPTLKVTRELLGKILVRRYRGKELAGKIVETEAYIGSDDKACHAARGRTKRNEIMFGPAGHAYVYIVYGMHYCLNIVTEAEKFPAAVLIRAIEPVDNIDIMKRYRNNKTLKDKIIANGPGKLCQALKINKSLNGINLLNDQLWIEDAGIELMTKDIIKAKRVGIDYAGVSKNLLWRFYVKDSKYISKK